MKNSDAQLIHRVLNGDETAFSALVKKYQKQVHALAWRKIGDFHIAEEITQDTFLRAYQKLRTLKKPQRFASWLYVIATNRCNTWLHKKHFRTQLLKNKGNAQPHRTYSSCGNVEILSRWENNCQYRGRWHNPFVGLGGSPQRYGTEKNKQRHVNALTLATSGLAQAYLVGYARRSRLSGMCRSLLLHDTDRSPQKLADCNLDSVWHV